MDDHGPQGKKLWNPPFHRYLNLIDNQESYESMISLIRVSISVFGWTLEECKAPLLQSRDRLGPQ